MEKYFVTSDGDTPDRIFFDVESAKQRQPRFIDSFDDKGLKVAIYELKFSSDQDHEYVKTDA